MSLSRISFTRKKGSERVPNGFLTKDECKESFEFLICISIIKLPHGFLGYLPNSKVLHKFVFIDLTAYCLDYPMVIWGKDLLSSFIFYVSKIVLLSISFLKTEKYQQFLKFSQDKFLSFV